MAQLLDSLIDVIPPSALHKIMRLSSSASLHFLGLQRRCISGVAVIEFSRHGSPFEDIGDLWVGMNTLNRGREF